MTSDADGRTTTTAVEEERPDLSEGERAWDPRYPADDLLDDVDALVHLAGKPFFQRLTDASKLNRQPERIRIKTASKAMTLTQALTANGIAARRHEELAILNGMQRTDKLSAGMLYKSVGR